MFSGFNLVDIVGCLLEFRSERNWEKFHRPKELSAAISIEASELQEIFLWKEAETVSDIATDKVRMEKIREEIGDIAIFLIYLSHDLDINLKEAILNKLDMNRKKYPKNIYKGIYQKPVS